MQLVDEMKEKKNIEGDIRCLRSMFLCLTKIDSSNAIIYFHLLLCK